MSKYVQMNPYGHLKALENMSPGLKIFGKNRRAATRPSGPSSSGGLYSESKTRTWKVQGDLYHSEAIGGRSTAAPRNSWNANSDLGGSCPRSFQRDDVGTSRPRTGEDEEEDLCHPDPPRKGRTRRKWPVPLRFQTESSTSGA